MCILQKKYWQANLKDIGTPKKLTMCTGPHRFTKFQGDGTSELVAFDGYWGGRPAVRTRSWTLNAPFVASKDNAIAH